MSAMTMREWLMEREKRGERLLSHRGHPEWGDGSAATWLAEFGTQRPYTDELDDEVEEATLSEMYLDKGKIGHIGRTAHLVFVYLTDTPDAL